MIATIKLFYQDAAPMVALYGPATAESDGWQCNLPAAEVIKGDPSPLPAEQQLSIAAAANIVRFTEGFQARLDPGRVPIRLEGFVDQICEETGLPRADVRRIVVRMLGQLRAVVERGGQFNDALLRIRPPARVTRPGSVSSGGDAPLATAVLLLMPPKPAG